MVGTVSLAGFEILGEAVEHDGNSRANLETGTIHKKMGSPLRREATNSSC